MQTTHVNGLWKLIAQQLPSTDRPWMLADWLTALRVAKSAQKDTYTELVMKNRRVITAVELQELEQFYTIHMGIEKTWLLMRNLWTELTWTVMWMQVKLYCMPWIWAFTTQRLGNATWETTQAMGSNCANIFEIKKKHLLYILDYFSKFPIIKKTWKPISIMPISMLQVSLHKIWPTKVNNLWCKH